MGIQYMYNMKYMGIKYLGIQYISNMKYKAQARYEESNLAPTQVKERKEVRSKSGKSKLN